ncbi:MAG: imidazoleglycerol-phosphate dehydratase HisB [Actinobacteria bacterium]|nr:imidazoleglycerol-phosphate dehydratase HisB [Actinomycetota bacterium]
MERKARVERKTGETSITLLLDLDGQGRIDIDTPLPFFNHVLESFARHGKFGLTIKASGDIEVGSHHLVEDTGICLGKAVKECLKDKKGITRFGFIILPMDDAEIILSLDIGGRPYLRYDVDLEYEEINGLKTTVVEEFFRAFTGNSFINLHIRKSAGLDSHHIIEAIFKAFGIAFHNASRTDNTDGIPSTKGLI